MSVALRSVAGAERPSITAQGVWHRYGPGRGLEPVSFAWCGPSVAAVTGANGSGKSTLLKVLAGLVAPSGGTATLSIGGSVVPNRARRRCVGYASPDLMFYDELSCAENLAFAGEALGLRDVRGAFTAALDQVGLGRVAEDRPGALSSGMLQRLRLALALLHGPAVLLLDEPTSHMDDEGRDLVARVVERHRRAGLVVIASNDEREWRIAEQRIELRGRGLGGAA